MRADFIARGNVFSILGLAQVWDGMSPILRLRLRLDTTQPTPHGVYTHYCVMVIARSVMVTVRLCENGGFATGVRCQPAG